MTLFSLHFRAEITCDKDTSSCPDKLSLLVSLSLHLSFSVSPPRPLHPSPPFLPLSPGLAASSEPLIFSADGTEEEEEEVILSGDCCVDGTAPWYLRVQELAHDSLIAATRAQLAKDAKASQDARAGNGSNSNVTDFNGGG